MRRTLFLAAVVGLGLGCHNPKPATKVTPAACQGLTGAPVPFDTMRVQTLAGTYDLALMDTISVPGHQSVRTVGRLKLWAQDSVRSLPGIPERLLPRGRGLERPIAGSFVRTPPDTSARGRWRASEDLDRPGAVWEFSRLFIGDYDWLDGTGDDLVPREVYRNGFSGAWRMELGNGIIVDRTGRAYRPGGYFCARRVG